MGMYLNAGPSSRSKGEKYRYSVLKETINKILDNHICLSDEDYKILSVMGEKGLYDRYKLIKVKHKK